MWLQVDTANAELDDDLLAAIDGGIRGFTLDIDMIWSHFGGGTIGVTTWTASIANRRLAGIDGTRSDQAPRQCLMAFGAVVSLACFRVGC